MPQALSGYRIVDFTQVFAGPFATQQLAQLGADVIKVEPPGTGDTTRGGLTEPTGGKVPAGFVTCNIGKRSLTLDLKSESGLEAARRLVATADALVENFRPGVMARLGLGFEQVREIKPDIVYCSISGYGQTGEKATRPAFDGAIQADSGMMSITGTEATGPLRTGYFGVDMSTAMNAAFAITASLLRRARCGEGQHIDVAMMDTALSMQAPQYAAYLTNGRIPGLIGNHSPTGQPTANVFPTSDGYLQVVALKDNQAMVLFGVLGLEYLGERFPTPRDRIKNADEIRAAIGDVMKQHHSAHWFSVLLEAGIPVSDVRTIDQVAAEHQRAFVEVPLTSGSDERITTVAGGHQANIDAPQVPGAAPRLGENSEEILRELGFSDADIKRMERDGNI